MGFIEREIVLEVMVAALAKTGCELMDIMHGWLMKVAENKKISLEILHIFAKTYQSLPFLQFFFLFSLYFEVL